MNARLIGAAVVITSAITAGCTTSTHSVAASEKQRAALAVCDQVTGSRLRASREHSDCQPVGYPFRELTIEQVHSWGYTDLNTVFQPRR